MPYLIVYALKSDGYPHEIRVEGDNALVDRFFSGNSTDLYDVSCGCGKNIRRIDNKSTGSHANLTAVLDPLETHGCKFVSTYHDKAADCPALLFRF